MSATLVIEKLKQRKKSIAVAESCTGGLFSGSLTSVPGSSDCFGYGLVTYSNKAKHHLLNIPWGDLNIFGAVSYETAFWMAKSVKTIAQADLGFGITGIAGPTGASINKPVGLVYMALAEGSFSMSRKFYLTGTREEIRALTVKNGLDMILTHLI